MSRNLTGLLCKALIQSMPPKAEIWVAEPKRPNLNLKSNCCSSTLGVLLDAGEPERHVLAGGGHQHVLGVELDALHGARVVAVQHAHLRPVLRVPDVDPPVRRPRDDELQGCNSIDILNFSCKTETCSRTK